jgi:GT2 family glycosyltransferase
MTLLARDEEDIISYNIDFHLSKGVDFIIATNNGSKDATREILGQYEKKGVLHLIDEKSHNHNQAQWNNRMAEIARDQYGADIIFHCDADEFWYPRSGNLKDEISDRPEDILIVDVINILLSDKGGGESFPTDTRFAVVNPIVAKDYMEETKNENMFYFKYPPKVIFKPAKKILLVSQGNHSVTNKDDSIKEGPSHDILIYHYPIRSKANFYRKTILGGSAYESTDIHPKDHGFHKRRWYASYKKGLLDEDYKRLILCNDDADNFLRDGFIEEINFSEAILGETKKCSNTWHYYNRKFEYENIFQDFYWSWAGHKSFAYDLVRNVKPKVIVELGTHKGTSFYVFCQAVKDSFYDADLHAIDTWQGDEHAGYYGENVFKEVNEIKNKYYNSMKINLLRKRFDDAVSEFGEQSIDLLHIDGLHTYDAVKHDFDTWLPKVKEDGIILMHDIFINRDDFGVFKFWEELKRDYHTIEFYQSYGLGVLLKNGKKCQTVIDKGKEWQIRYAYLAEDKKNGEIGKVMARTKQMLSVRDEQILNLDQKIKEQEGRIIGLNHAVQTLAGELAKRNAVVAEQDQMLTKQTQRLSALMPLVSIVVVNFNGLHFLNSLISSLLIQSYPHFEIILVDNASSDQTVSFVKENFPAVRLIESKRNLGFAGGNNLGIQAARGDLIALINSDTVVDRDWLYYLMETIQSDGNIGAVGSKILFFKPYLEFTITSKTFSPAGLSSSTDTRDLGLLLDEASSVANCLYQKPVFLDGFFGRELIDGRTVRWSGNVARLMLPFEAETEDLFLSFISAGREGGAGNRFKVSIQDTVIGEGILERTFTEYRFTIPARLARSNAFNLINNAGTMLDNKGNAHDRGIYQPDQGQFDKMEDVPALCGASMLIRGNALDKTGLFDSNFYLYFEDVDLSYRLRANGFRLQYQPKSIVYHKHASSSKEWSPVFVFYTVRNRILIKFKNFVWGDALRAYLIEGAKCASRVIRYSVLRIRALATGHDREDVSLHLKIQLSLIKQIPLAILKRLQILSDPSKHTKTGYGGK